MKHISINYIFTTALALGAGISIPVLVGSTCLSEQILYNRKYHTVSLRLPSPNKQSSMATPSTSVVTTDVNAWTVK